MSLNKVCTKVIAVLAFGLTVVIDYRIFTTTVDGFKHRLGTQYGNANDLSNVHCLLAKCASSHRSEQRGAYVKHWLVGL